MNRYKLSKAGVSPNAGIQRFNGDKDLYEKMLNSFVDDPHYDQLCQAIEKRDVKEAFAAAHALKGVSGNLSMTRLFEDIQPLVETLRAGSLENVEALLETVTKDYQEVIAVLS